MNQEKKTTKSSRKHKTVENAKRYKDRMKNEHRWLEIQAIEKEDRIQQLEGTIQSLSKELSKSPKKRKSKHPPDDQNKRPSWFGDPF